MRLLLYVVTFLGGILGALILFSTVLADGAPQQGAGAAVAVAFVVIPYCMARVIGESHKEHLLEKLANGMTTQAQAATPPQPVAPVAQPTAQPSPYAPPARNPFAPKVKV